MLISDVRRVSKKTDCFSHRADLDPVCIDLLIGHFSDGQLQPPSIGEGQRSLSDSIVAVVVGAEVLWRMFRAVKFLSVSFSSFTRYAHWGVWTTWKLRWEMRSTFPEKI